MSEKMTSIKNSLRILYTIIAAFLFAAPLMAQLQQADNTSLAKDFLSRLEKGDFGGAVAFFDANLASKLPADKLRQTWELVQKQAGPYKGILSSSSERIPDYELVYLGGGFANFNLEIKLSFNADHRISGIFFAPLQPKAAEGIRASYDKAELYTERSVTVQTGKFSMPGTLTLPSSGKDFPVLVLVHGSGPHDADQTIGPNKPFANLAHGLAAQGIATLRYEKRTHKYGSESAADPAHVTVDDETVADALSALSLAASLPEINNKKVFLLGHSLGGMMAPRIAAKAQGLAGVILMAANARPLEDLVLEQYIYIDSLTGRSEQMAAELGKIRSQIATLRSKSFSLATSGEDLPLGLPASYWMDLKDYSQTKTAAALKLPVLVLQGERDYQVTMKDFSLWKKAAAGRKNFFFISYPRLNHLFMSGEGKALPSEYEKAGFVDEAVIRDIAAWMKK